MSLFMISGEVVPLWLLGLASHLKTFKCKTPGHSSVSGATYRAPSAALVVSTAFHNSLGVWVLFIFLSLNKLDLTRFNHIAFWGKDKFLL